MVLILSDDIYAVLPREEEQQPTFDSYAGIDAAVPQPAPYAPEAPISDGLGHVWNSATQAWDNDNGTPYEEIQSYPQPAPVSYSGRGFAGQIGAAVGGAMGFQPPPDDNGFDAFAGQQVFIDPDYQIPVPFDMGAARINSGQGQFYDKWTPTDSGYEALPNVGPIDPFPQQTIGPYEGDFDAGRNEFMDTLATPARRLYEQGLDYEDPQLLDIARRPGQANPWDLAKPFDYLAEVGADATPQIADTLGLGNAYRLGDKLLEQAPFPVLNPPDMPTSAQSRREVLGDFTDPGQALHEYRDRPLYQQFAAGAFFDPLNAFGVGNADEAVDLARAAGRYGDDAAAGFARGALRVGDEFGQAMGRSMQDVGEFTGLGPGLPRSPIIKAATRETEDTPEFTNAARKILDATTSEANIRRVGTAEREIREGRGTQFGNIFETLTEGQARGLSPEDAAIAARRSSAVGPLRKTFADPIELATEEKHAVIDAINQRIRSGNLPPHAIYNAVGEGSALERLLSGSGLQPKQIEWIREVFGDDVAKAVVDRPKGQRFLTDAQEALANQRREADIVARASREAERELQRANRAVSGQQIKDDARAIRERWRGIAAENAATEQQLRLLRDPLQTTTEQRGVAERLLSQADLRLRGETEALNEQALTRQAREVGLAERQAGRAAARSAEATDLREARGRWQAIAKSIDEGAALSEQVMTWLRNPLQNTPEMRQIAERALTQIDRKLARETERLNSAAVLSQGRDARLAAQKEAQRELRNALRHDKLDANDEQLLAKAKKLLGEDWPASQSLRQDVLTSVDYWLRGNRALLDGLGETRHEALAAIKAAITGDVADSYLTSLLHRKGFLIAALEHQGIEPDLAKKVGQTLVDYELARRYPRGIPAEVTRHLANTEIPSRLPERTQDLLKETKALPYGEKGAISGLASLSQELKNTQFGIGDFAVLGQQVRKAAQTGNINILAGAVNRVLNLAHLGLQTGDAEALLAKRIVYQLDGVGQGVSTGMTDLTRDGTLFQHIPLIGKKVDVPLVWLTRKLTDLQFGNILGSLRNLNYEGNLVLAKLAGADIANPAVRATAGDFANFNTSYWHAALNTRRAEFEKATLLSAPMRRAQVAQIVKVAKGLASLDRTQTILAASTIASWAMTVLAVQKVLNDYVGIGDFEWDPSKPGFGNVTLPGGTVLNAFSQEQVLIAVGRSFRHLAEQDPEAAAEDWGRLLLSSQSPGLKFITGSAGFGFDPTRGYRWGDLGEGMSTGERLLSNAPIPPIGADIIREGLDKVRTPLEAIGINTFKESPSSELARKFKAETGKDYFETVKSREGRVEVDAWLAADPSRQALSQRSLGDSAKRGSEGAQRKLEADAAAKPFIEKQVQDDSKLAEGGLGPADWRENRSDRQFGLRQRKDQIYAAAETKEEQDAVDRYYAIVDKYTTDPTIKRGTDWDRVEAEVATLPEADRAFVQRFTGQGGTETERRYRTDVKAIADSGYWDVSDMAAQIWGQKLGIEVKTLGELETAMRDGYTAALEDAGLNQAQALIKAEQLIDEKLGDMYEKVQEVHKKMRKDPELMRLLVTWGYYKPGKESMSDALRAVAGE